MAASTRRQFRAVTDKWCSPPTPGGEYPAGCSGGQKTSGGGVVSQGGLSGGLPARSGAGVGGKSGGVDAGGTGGDIAPGGSTTSSGGDCG